MNQHKLSVVKMTMLQWMSRQTRKDKTRKESIKEKVKVSPIEDKMTKSHLSWSGYMRKSPSKKS